MKIENQVVSLELAKKLKELGVKQESYFWYQIINEPPMSIEIVHYNTLHFAEYISAFTVAELGEMLPVRICSGKRKNLPFRFYCNYDMPKVSKGGNHQENADTEADARAAMLIYLLENKLLSVK